MQAQDLWEKAVAFHGHACPGLATGLRAALIGMRELGVARAGDEELVAIVETDSCSIDAVQVLTGCTVGKGNLILRDLGKHVFTFARRSDGRGVRVAVRHRRREEDPGERALFDRVRAGTATEEEREAVKKRRQERIQELLEMPEQELFAVRPVQVELPAPAQVFTTVPCQQCGEGVMEPRAHLQDGKVVCGDCFRAYPARWVREGSTR